MKSAKRLILTVALLATLVASYSGCAARSGRGPGDVEPPPPETQQGQ